MPRKWTPEQLSAIETRDKTLLVSAAAGSGKTTVLTERLIRLLTAPENPASLDRMLIVTFTRAAAAELRQRISAALGEALAADPTNRHLHRQLLALSSAKISTIHAYCLELIRANFQRLGLPAQFRVADEAEIRVLSRSLMNDLIAERYAADIAFGSLADHFTGARNDSGLADIFLKLTDALSNYPEGIEFLRAQIAELREGDISLQRGWGKIAAERIHRVYRDAEAFFSRAMDAMEQDEALSTAYLPAFSADYDHIRQILDCPENCTYSALREALLSYSPQSLKPLAGKNKSEESERFREYRDNFKKLHKKLCDSFFLLDNAGLSHTIAQTADAIEQIYVLLRDYNSRLSEEKRRRGICDFADIERYTLALLVDEKGEDTDIARAVADGFDVICIDEYQDVNAVQDRIFRAIARPKTRFMVGDIKQSIYRFRGAEPSIFADYRRQFPALGQGDTEEENASIFMSNNFRCDLPIIQTANRIFSFLFGYCGESIGYLPEDDLVCGKASVGQPAPVTLALLPPAEENEEEESSLPEYHWIATEIVRLLREETLDDGRPIRLSDIAILMRSKTDIDRLTTALRTAGIAVESGAADDFFEKPEVLMMLCLLNTIDNPNRDIYLAGTLRSPLFGFTMDELIAVRAASPEAGEPLYAAFRRYTEENAWQKGEQFLSRLREYRAMAEGTPVDRLLNALYRDTAILAFAGADEGEEEEPRPPEQKRANLLLLYDYARRFEAGSYKGLYNFIRYINDIIDEGTKIEAPAAASEDAVRIMSIHHTKGLEFPVCFVCGLGRRFNLRDTSDNLLFSHDVGIAIRLRDESGFARRTTPLREAIAAHLIDTQLEEEMRVLYVALTRARERLYLTAQCKKDTADVLTGAAERRAVVSADALMRCSNYLEWILTALIDTPQDVWQLCTPERVEKAALLPQTSASSGKVCTAEADDATVNLLRERFAYVYPYAHLTHLPAKLAVSRLYPTLLDDEMAPDSLNEQVKLPEMRIRPACLDGDSVNPGEAAAERGTATHVFLQFCNFSHTEIDRAAIDREAERLIADGFITPRMAELLRRDELAAFFAGPIYAELTNARWILRERRFHLNFPAADFTDDPDYAHALGDEQILVQGVIDLCFETADGKLVLCDYKTDRLPRDLAQARKTLIARHADQLRYYAAACQALFGRTPDRICLWSLALGEAVDVNCAPS
ncbi:MAG: UvrD-helicase domain-containing protein [Clostridia bacterium]|nr:UvrD-helicase domain-containing protein [Clostridia bacterium]